MSVGITQIGESFRMAADKKSDALIAICRWWEDLSVGTLEEALQELDVYSETDGDGNIVLIDLTTGRLRYLQDDLVDCLAPYVDSGSYLELCTDGGEVFRYVFEDGCWYDDYLGEYLDLHGGDAGGDEAENDQDELPAGGAAAERPGTRCTTLSDFEW